MTDYGEVTVERLERGLAIMAYIITLDSRYTPLFEKLEGELEAMRRQGSTVERARRLLESYRHPRVIADRCSQHRPSTK